jgi:hypothetical protein
VTVKGEGIRMKTAEKNIEEFLKDNFVCECDEKEKSFSEYVFQKVDELLENKLISKESDIYIRGNIDRRVYSNLKKATSDYRPKKNMCLAYCIGLGLCVSEAEELLQLAGYKFNVTSLTDQIVKCCLELGIYSAREVNIYIALFAEEYKIPAPMYIGSNYRNDEAEH